MPAEFLGHECAVVGAYHPDLPVAMVIYQALVAMENRGRENCGIGFPNQDYPLLLKNRGSASEYLGSLDLKQFPHRLGVGHNRYGTTGGSGRENAQPFLVNSDIGKIFLAHNGNLINSMENRRRLERLGITFESTSDSEVMAQLIANAPGKDLVSKIKNATPLLEGAYSYVAATNNLLVAGKDPHGVWPLVLGKYNHRGLMVASESTAIHAVNGRVLRHLSNGEMVIINKDGDVYFDEIEKRQEANCIFEPIYFHRMAGEIHERKVSDMRYEMGRNLAREHPIKADFVIPVPNTAITAAKGYEAESGVKYLQAIAKVDKERTFMAPTQEIRERKAGVKYAINTDSKELFDKRGKIVLKGKRVVVIDDSIVRGTTTPILVNMLREMGVKEVHLRIHSPEFNNPCYLGVDISTKKEIAMTRLGGVEQIRVFSGADSLAYLSLSGLMRSIQLNRGFCTGCFTGEYPIAAPEERDKFELEKVLV